MFWAGSLAGNQAPITRKMLIGDAVVAEQIICYCGGGGNGLIGDPASVNDYTEALGVSMEAGTYSTTQGSGGQCVETTVSPFDLIRGKVSGGTTADTAWVDDTDGNLMTGTAASAGCTTVADTDVGTSEYVGGYMIGLSGANKGQVRVIDSHTDNVSEVVDDPFDNAIAATDTFLRTFAPLLQGIELTTSFTQFQGRTGAGADLPDTGHAVVYDVLMGGQTITVPNATDAENPYAYVDSETNPLVEITVVLIDHAFNSVA